MSTSFDIAIRGRNKPAGLTTVPFEILHAIFSSPGLDWEDIKSARLACKRFQAPAEALLFYEIRISFLHRDRDNFRRIVASKHLAQHVRSLSWEELTANPETLKPSYWTPDRSPTTEDDYVCLLDDLLPQALDLFWLHGPLGNEAEAVSTFMPEFLHAVRALPNLHTIMSRPMRPERELQSAADGVYPLTVEFIRNYSLYPKSPHNLKELPEGTPSDVTGNLGFNLFLFQLLRLENLSIKQLFYEDQYDVSNGLTVSSGLMSLNTTAIPFTHLQHANICLGVDEPDTDKAFDGLVSLLNNSPNLESLHLCRERCHPIERIPDRFWMRLQIPRLRELSLRGIFLASHRRVEALAALLEKHRGTVRTLSLIGCSATVYLLKRMQRINLQLESVTIMLTNVDYKSTTENHITEANVLEFLNSRHASTYLLGGTYRPEDEFEWVVRTHEIGPDFDGHCTRQPPPEIDQPSVYELGNDEQDARMDDPPAWGLGKDDEDQIWYWQDPSAGIGSYPTSIWHFQHHNGEEAYGREPLDFWSDWEGSDAGDHAIPTPFGPELDHDATDDFFVEYVPYEEWKHYDIYKYDADEDPYQTMYLEIL